MSDMHSKTEMQATIGEHVAAYSAARLRETVTLAGRFRDVSEFAVKGVDKISFPHLAKLNIQNRVLGEAGTKQKTKASKESIPLNYNAYVSYGIDGSSEIESALNWKMELAALASEAHVDDFGINLLNQVKSVAQTIDIAVEAGKNPLVAQLVTLRKNIRDSKAPLSECFFIINTEMEAEILENADLFKIDGFGAPLIVNGEIKKLYGLDVEIFIDADKASVVWGKSICYGIQLQTNYAEQPDLDYGTQGVRCAMDQKYGTGALYLIEAGETNAGKSLVCFKVGAVTIELPETTEPEV